MNQIREIQRLNERELKEGIPYAHSWHGTYKNSAYIFIGGLDYDLTEGDLIKVFSQFGEVVDCHLVRDKITGKSKGFCFLAYEDQRSTALSIDNMNGSKILGRTVRVDHAGKYRKPKAEKKYDPVTGLEIEREDDDDEYDERRRKIWDYEMYNLYETQQRERATAARNEWATANPLAASSAAVQANKGGDEIRQDRIAMMLAQRKAARAAGGTGTAPATMWADQPINPPSSVPVLTHDKDNENDRKKKKKDKSRDGKDKKHKHKKDKKRDRSRSSPSLHSSLAAPSSSSSHGNGSNGTSGYVHPDRARLSSVLAASSSSSTTVGADTSRRSRSRSRSSSRRRHHSSRKRSRSRSRSRSHDTRDKRRTISSSSNNRSSRSRSRSRSPANKGLSSSSSSRRHTGNNRSRQSRSQSR